MTDMSLCTLLDTHLQVDAVANDVDLGGLQLIEQVTVVPIVVADGILIFRQALLHQLLVVDIAFLHAQGSVQVVGGYHGVTHPGDVTDIVFLTLIDLHIDVDVLLVHRPYRVFQNGGVTVAQFVIFVNERRLGLFIAFRGKLLGLEHVLQLAGLIDLAESTLLEHGTGNFAKG